MVVGSQSYTYQVVENWGKLPEGWGWGQIGGIAVDSRDRIFVFARTAHPVMIFDQEGNLIGSWGEGVFSRPHGIYIGPGDVVFCSDDKDHTVRKFTADGKLLQTLGTKDQPSDTGYDGQNLSSIARGAGPFNRPTKLAIAPNGEMYVSDGYGNARVHKFTADGTYLFSWGEPGTGPSQFVLPHCVWVDKNNRVLVCDRENHRIQIFTPEGKRVEQWGDFRQPGDICIDPDGAIYVAELQNRISILSLDGKLLARWGGQPGLAPDQVSRAHGIAVDSRGDLYVGGVDPKGYNPKKFIRQR